VQRPLIIASVVNVHRVLEEEAEAAQLLRSPATLRKIMGLNRGEK